MGYWRSGLPRDWGSGCGGDFGERVVRGEMQNFHGMELCWGGDMTGAEMISQMQSAYVPSLIRRSSVWTFKAGKSVCLLREPGGAVWVLQEYTKAVDPSLTPDNLDSLGKKYTTLPQGWKFETKILEKDLVLDTTKAGGWAAIIRDDLHGTYQGCGYGKDTSANYVP